MRNLIHAELLKLRTTRMFYGNALAALAFVPVQPVHHHPDRRRSPGPAPRSTPAKGSAT